MTPGRMERAVRMIALVALLLAPVGTTFPALDLPPDRTAIVRFNLPESFRDRSNDVWEAPPPDDSAAPKDPAAAAAAG